MAVKVFKWKPFEIPKARYGHNVNVTTFESGKEQRKYLNKKPTEWTLSFKTTYKEMMEIQSFYESCRGSFESFTWTDCYSGQNKRVRFSIDDLEISTQWQKNGTFTIKLTEVL